MKSLSRILAARWLQLQPRERRLAFWCGVVILCSGLLTLEDWQRREQLRLEKALPAAEARLASMQIMADELSRLTARKRNQKKVMASPELLVASIRTEGLPLAVSITGTSQVALTGAVVFDQWVSWLAGAALQGWRVDKATVQRDATASGERAASTVTVETTLSASSD